LQQQRKKFGNRAQIENNQRRCALAKFRMLLQPFKIRGAVQFRSVDFASWRAHAIVRVLTFARVS
jgi:hypothetical protein